MDDTTLMDKLEAFVKERDDLRAQITEHCENMRLVIGERDDARTDTHAEHEARLVAEARAEKAVAMAKVADAPEGERDNIDMVDAVDAKQDIEIEKALEEIVRVAQRALRVGVVGGDDDG